MLATLATLFALLVLSNALEKNQPIVNNTKPLLVNTTASDLINSNDKSSSQSSSENSDITRSKSSDQDKNKKGHIYLDLLPDNITSEVKSVLKHSLDVCKLLLNIDRSTLPRLEDITDEVMEMDEDNDGDEVFNNTNITKQIRLLLFVNDLASFCENNIDLIDANSTVVSAKDHEKELSYACSCPCFVLLYLSFFFFVSSY
jgi:hypothetical protein